jgi:transcriptional regulator
MPDESNDAKVKTMKAQGKSNHEIADALGITPMEVETCEVDTMPLPAAGEKGDAL